MKKRFTSLVLIVVMILAIMPVFEVKVYASNVSVRTEQELNAALRDTSVSTITLLANIEVRRGPNNINHHVTIRGNHVISSGDSLHWTYLDIRQGGRVVFDGPTLSGGVAISDGGELILENGMIAGRVTISRGETSSFVMNGGTIGSFENRGGSFVMNDGLISGVTGVELGRNGGVTWPGGSFIMNGGRIVAEGTGVSLGLEAEFTMAGGSIEGGIGVSMGGWFNGTFIWTGGTISGDIVNNSQMPTPSAPNVTPSVQPPINQPNHSSITSDALANVTDSETAVQAVRETLSSATQAELAAGQLELFADNAIARAAQIQVGNNIQISQATVSQSQAVAHQTQTAIESMLQQNNYQLQRDLRPSVAFISDSEQISINIDPTTQNTSIEQFIVLTPSFSITFSEAFVESEVRTAPLTVSITAGNSYEVVFSRPIAQPARIAVPCNNNSNYMAIQRRSNGDFVGGIRNPVTGKREAFITASDTYVVVENRVDFTDIQHLSREAQNAIRHLASHGMISGVGGGRFDPNASINRAQIAQLVTRMLGIHDPNANGGFADVQRADWFFGAAGSANHHGIMHGTGNNRFSPHMILPRDQLTALSARVLRTRMGYRTPTNPNAILQRFADRNDFANWSIDDLALATQVQLFIPRADDRFMPRDSMTRGDAALILYRLYNRLW